MVRTDDAVACCSTEIPMKAAKGAYFCIAVWISGYEYFRTFDRSGQLKVDVTGIKEFPRLISVLSLFK